MYLKFQFTSLDSDCQYLAVAGRTGLAHYSILQRKWRLFGNETQEKDFIVTGGLVSSKWCNYMRKASRSRESNLLLLPKNTKM